MTDYSKNCHCGGKDAVRIQSIRKRGWQIDCLSCGTALIVHQTKAAAMEMWNTLQKQLAKKREERLQRRRVATAKKIEDTHDRRNG
jgi:hypothetical protein